MTRPPFNMMPSRMATLTRDGRHLVTGRSSYVWQQYLRARAAGVPGDYAIKIVATSKPHPWHDLAHTVDDAEAALLAFSVVPGAGQANVNRARRTRQHRADRGLPVG